MAAHARTSPHARAAFSAAPPLPHLLRFGFLPAMWLAKRRDAQAQSGRLSFGSLLTAQQRQSATRHRLVGCLSFGSQRTGCAAPKCHSPLPSAAYPHDSFTRINRRLANSLETMKGAHMQSTSGSSHGQVAVCSTPSPSLLSLTVWSRGRLHGRSLRAGRAGAPYRGR
jgi:hypothetical protein